ncbi:hypothetical protein CHS0354_012154 [Potamilus streckersoni]|uniref:HECT-type E3 ubiquitin transferase n=1 Tax=Potamilus streckersoni TaxID=2493646 RepID=A0AAE0SAM8_9BIVA|nr:hypothetical protein CHS0354_012154 [Potamilus streckersoni]
MGSVPSSSINDSKSPLRDQVKPSRKSQLRCKSPLQRPSSSLSISSKSSLSPFSVLPPVTSRNEINGGRPTSGSKKSKTSRHKHNDEERVVYLPDERKPLPAIGNTNLSNEDEGTRDIVKTTTHKSSFEDRCSDGYNLANSGYDEEEPKIAIKASFSAASIENPSNDDSPDQNQSDTEIETIDSSKSPTKLYWDKEGQKESDEEEENYDPDIGLDSERSIEDILSEMRDTFNDSGYITLCINRSFVWRSALEQFHQENFSPADGFEVIFVDDDGKEEGATDAGGPKREYFQLLMDHLANCSLFEGPPGRKLLSYDVQANRRNEYFYAGMVIGQSLLNDGPVPHFLSPLLLDCLILEPENVTGSREDIYDSDWLQLLDEVQKTDSIRDFVMTHNKTLHLAGCLRNEKMENKDQLIQDLINYYLVERTRPAFEKFKQGLDSVEVYHYILSYPDQFRELFSRQEPLTAEKMSAMFTICYSYIYSQGGDDEDEEEEEENVEEEGDKEQEIDVNMVIEAETKTVEFWENYIHIVEAQGSQVTLADIMMFTTGMKEQPYGQCPKIYFCHSHDGEPASRYPRSSTCSCVLYLPLYETFEEFKEAMDFGILNGIQFGHV